MEQQMRLSEVLSELELLDRRIEKKYSILSRMAVGAKDGDIIYGLSVDDYKKQYAADYQSLTDLIEYKLKLERAKMMANSTAKVTIAGQEMTIAEALVYKAKVLPMMNEVLEELKGNYSSVVNNISNRNAQVQTKADEYAVSVIGSSSKDTKNNALDVVRKTYLDTHEYKLVEAIDVKKTIDELESKIEQLNRDFKSALSIANIETVVTIDC
mgnify:CR=1 FL=1